MWAHAPYEDFGRFAQNAVRHRQATPSYSGAKHQTVQEAEMNYLMLLQTVGLLGLRLRYWVIIIVVVLVLIGLAYMARGRSR
jgi:hypothetical protein